MVVNLDAVDVMVFFKEENVGLERTPSAPPNKLPKKQQKPKKAVAKEKQLIVRLQKIGPMLIVGAMEEKEMATLKTELKVSLEVVRKTTSFD
jgi:hypothetical protein